MESLPVKLLFNCDEETGSRDSRRLIEEEAAGAAGAFVFEGRRESDHALVTARKGILMGSMQVHGRAAHAGEEPEKGASAILSSSPGRIAVRDFRDAIPVVGRKLALAARSLERSRRRAV